MKKTVTGYEIQIKDNKYILGEKTTKEVCEEPVGIGVYATCIVDDHFGSFGYDCDNLIVDENFVDVNINNLEKTVSSAYTIADIHNNWFFIQENDIALNVSIINHDGWWELEV